MIWSYKGFSVDSRTTCLKLLYTFRENYKYRLCPKKVEKVTALFNGTFGTVNTHRGSKFALINIFLSFKVFVYYKDNYDDNSNN